MSANPVAWINATLRAVHRRLYWWPRDRLLLQPLRGIRTAVAFGESLGDNLLCANVLAGLHAAGAGPLAMLTPFPELFAGLPFPVRCRPFDPAVISALRRGGPRLFLPSYGNFDATLDRHVPPPRAHLLVEMCRSVGLPGEIALKPLLVLTPAERAACAARAADHLLVQCSNLSARMPAGNKEWPVGRWQTVVNTLGKNYPVAQIGAADDPPLAGVLDWRGRLTLRETAAALSGARLFLGTEGFLMHLARAVDCRAVIVLGGRTAPHQTCYAEHAVLFTALPCAPCWQRNLCAYDRACLERITPDDVIAAAEAQLALPPLRASK